MDLTLRFGFLCSGGGSNKTSKEWEHGRMSFRSILELQLATHGRGRLAALKLTEQTSGKGTGSING